MKVNIQWIVITALILLTSATSQAQTGYKSLFIGHSFFKLFADGMMFHTAQAGITGHTQDVIFSGGCTGAPQALWENEIKGPQIKAILDNGDVEFFGMTYCDEYPTIEGYINWFNYALSKNPNTRFALALPWEDYPAAKSTSEYASHYHNSHDNAWHDLIDALRSLYPGVEIICIPYGRSAVELRQLLDAGNLPDVDVLTGTASNAIYVDNKGHAGNILKELGKLVWLNAIYGVDLSTYAYEPAYTTDLKAIAQMIMDEHDGELVSSASIPIMGNFGLLTLGFSMLGLGAARIRKK